MISRYERHRALPEIGEEGQRRLSRSRVAVVGAGGLGSPALYHLASAGVGHIQIIDSDVVELTNLNRQFLHFQEDMGREKTQSAKDKLHRYNPDIQILTTTVTLDETNVAERLTGYDAVLSCVDNHHTRQLLNKACVRSATPLIDGGVGGFEGYVLTVLPLATPCYQCVFPNGSQSAEGVGVLGAVAGVVGSMMAVEAIKLLVGIPLSAHLHFVDMLTLRVMPIQGRKAEGCAVCGE